MRWMQNENLGALKTGGTETVGTVSISNPEILPVVLQVSWQGLDVQLVGVSSGQRAMAAPVCRKGRSSDWSNYRAKFWVQSCAGLQNRSGGEN